MTTLSPTQRTLKELRNLGRVCAIVEKWQILPGHPGGGIRKDLFGFIDILVIDPSLGFIGVQSCGQAFSEHYKKITDSDCTENAICWLKSGGKIELWAWRKIKVKRGGKALIWQPRIKQITMEDFEDKNGLVEMENELEETEIMT